jgi:phage shock protein A
MSDIKDELDNIRRKISAAERKQAVAEAQREQAKADLKASLQKAADEYGVRSLQELEQKIERLRAERDEKMAALREAAREL